MARQWSARTWIGVLSVAWLFGATAAGAVDVPGTQATLEWAPAKGPVGVYAVYVSRDGGPFQGAAAVYKPRVTLWARPGETLRVRVAAIALRRNGSWRRGPFSADSAPLHFVDAAPSGGGGGSSKGGAGAPTDDYRSHDLLRPFHGEVSGTGDFDGDGHEDVLFRTRKGSPRLLCVRNGRKVHGFRVVRGSGPEPLRGPRSQEGQASVLLLDRKQSLLRSLRFMGRTHGFRGQWKLAVDEIARPVTADLDGNGSEAILQRRADGRLLDGDGRPLPVPPLRDTQRVLVSDADADGHDDLVLADVTTGQLEVWRSGRSRRSAPDLDSSWEDVAVAHLEGGGVEVVGVDRAGRLMARDLFGSAVRRLGRPGAGSHVFAADVDHDGDQELVVQTADALQVWSPARP